MKKTILLILGVLAVILLTSIEIKEEEFSTDLVWDYYCEHIINKDPQDINEDDYVYYLDVFTETDEYLDLWEELYNKPYPCN